MRSNLLSLQQTQKLQDSTQLRLSTGLKVNSAVDNPSSYYTASSLNHRAEDLSALLDTMSQGIQTLKAANEGLETGTKILEQASALVMRQTEKSLPVMARVRTEEELLNAVNSGNSGAIIIENDISLSTDTVITLKNGQALFGAGYYDGTNQKVSLNFTIEDNIVPAVNMANNTTLAGLNINYNEIGTKNYSSLSKGVVDAESVENVRLVNMNINADISSTLGGVTTFGAINARSSSLKTEGNLAVNIQSVPASSVYGIHTYNAEIEMLSKTSITSSKDGIRLTERSHFNVYNELSIKSSSNGIYNLNSNLNFLSGSTLNVSAGTGLYIASAYNRESVMNVANGARLNFHVSSTQNAIYQYLNVSTGKESLVNYQKGAEINIYRNTAGDGLWLVDNDFSVSHTVKGPPALTTNSFSGPDVTQSAVEIPVKEPVFPYTDDDTFFYEKTDDISAEKSFNEILNQYDSVIKDSAYKGVNLLRQENLNIGFNEDRSSGLEIKGVDASAQGLGLNEASWDSQENVLKTMTELTSAINKIRSYMGEFGNYYSIVNTREDFTQNLINVLTEGADKLTLADMNAESANMLALQTRQQLAVNSLSLASQAAQSVLKLF